MHNKKASILVIDDVLANLTLFEAALALDFDVLSATSGALGFAMAIESPPDLILLDVVMPGMDGFETLSVFKAEPALSHIPLIFVTAVSDTESEMRALALGAADYIAKPFHMKIATRRIWNVIERERQRHSRPDSLRIETDSAAAAEARLAWRQEP